MEQERKILIKAKRMWVYPVLSRAVDAWNELIRDQKVSTVNARVLATWAGATLGMCFAAWRRAVLVHTGSQEQAQRPAAVDRLHLQINACMEEERLGKCPGLPLNPHRLNTKLVAPHVPLISPLVARLRELGWRSKAQQREMNLDRVHCRDVLGLPAPHATVRVRFSSLTPAGSSVMRASAALRFDPFSCTSHLES